MKSGLWKPLKHWKIRKNTIVSNPKGSDYNGVFIWCAMRDLNPHGRPLDPKSSASANSANRAYKIFKRLFMAPYKFE